MGTEQAPLCPRSFFEGLELYGCLFSTKVAVSVSSARGDGMGAAGSRRSEGRAVQPPEKGQRDRTQQHEARTRGQGTLPVTVEVNTAAPRQGARRGQGGACTEAFPADGWETRE